MAMTDFVAEEKWYDTLPSCRGMEDLFDFDHDGASNPPELPLLRRVCAQCPVFEQCFEDTMFYSDEFTFRAGMTPGERKRLSKKIGNKSWIKKQMEVLQQRKAAPHTIGGQAWREGCNCFKCSFRLTTTESMIAARDRKKKNR